MKILSYASFKVLYPSVFLEENYFKNKKIEVYGNDEVISGNLDLANLKNPRIYFKNLTVTGDIQNGFAEFAEPIIVLGTVTTSTLLISGNVYIDFNEVNIKSILAIYAKEGDVIISAGKTRIFLDDTEFSSNLLSNMKVDCYVSYFPIEYNRNVRHKIRFPDLANLFPEEKFIKENDEDEYLGEDEMTTYPITTSAWEIVEEINDYELFANNLIAKI